MTAPDRDEPYRPMKIVDLKLPLPYLLSAFGAFAMVLIGMWFTLAQVGRDVAELQVTVKGGNAQVTSIDREMARLQWRVELLEKNTVQRSDPPHTQPGRR